MQPRQNSEVKTLDFRAQIDKYGARNLILWFELEVNGEIVSENFISFVRPKHIGLPVPEISTLISRVHRKKAGLTPLF
ncbi:MAG: hypothetical protein ACOCZR_02675 [Halanaerobiales bacterium]